MKGVYCLIIHVNRNIRIKVGALGKINFKKGNYCYVGSAQNNVEKRIKRHFSDKKKIKWHIDYLLQNRNVKIHKAVYKEEGKDIECKIACILSQSEHPVKGFGSSDCKCISHLFRLKSLKSLKKIRWHANG
ncbi:DUF123 domain-containing protein [Candidatus Woesearchaeota archaeon]|nr:DUF123 domain-containing protein [Candidatus Woesearchaeota archaeon]